MVSDEQVRWIALFFLYSLMDEKIALQSAHKAIASLKARGHGDTPRSNVDADTDDAPVARSGGAKVAIVRAVKKVWDQQRKSMPKNRPVVMPESAWILPDHVDIAPWAKFQKDAADEQVIAVVLSRILGFSDQDIAEGLNVSLGTVRYRIGKGIRQLGSVAKTRA